MKDYHFDTSFSRTVFWSQYDLIQKIPLILENAWEQSIFTTMDKKGLELILNTPLAIFNMQMHRRKFLSRNTSQT